MWRSSSKAVELEEVGEFEGADVAAGVADLLLQVAYDLGQVLGREAGTVELKPEPLTVKAQGEVLTREAPVGLVQMLEGHRQGGSGRVHGASWATQGRSSRPAARGRR